MRCKLSALNVNRGMDMTEFKAGDIVKTEMGDVFTIFAFTLGHKHMPDGFIVQRDGDFFVYHNPESCTLYSGATSVLNLT
jgi:hypothetical protein